MATHNLGQGRIPAYETYTYPAHICYSFAGFPIYADMTSAEEFETFYNDMTASQPNFYVWWVEYEPKTETEPETESETQTETETETQPETESEPQTETEPQTESEPQTETEPQTESQNETETILATPADMLHDGLTRTSNDITSLVPIILASALGICGLLFCIHRVIRYFRTIQ